MDKERFIELWSRCVEDGSADAESVYNLIEAHYSEAHRFYHTSHHIEHCLSQFDLAISEMLEPDAVEMALWFHDVIYDVPTSENERRSAELFRDKTHGRVDKEFGCNVFDMILITMHRDLPYKHDDKLIVDIDLSSFGLPWEDCERESKNVRSEFAHKTDQEFYASHVKFMQSLLARDSFYTSDFFRDHYEETARKNVQRLIDQVKKSGWS